MDANVDKYDKMPNRSGMGRGDGKRHFMGNRINSMRKNLANKEQSQTPKISKEDFTSKQDEVSQNLSKLWAAYRASYSKEDEDKLRTYAEENGMSLAIYHEVAKDERSEIARIAFNGSVERPRGGYSENYGKIVNNPSEYGKNPRTTDEYSLEHSTLWNVMKQFPEFASIEKRIIKGMAQAGVPPEILPEMNLNDFRHLLFNHCSAGQSTSFAKIFPQLDANGNIIRDFRTQKPLTTSAKQRNTMRFINEHPEFYNMMMKIPGARKDYVQELIGQMKRGNTDMTGFLAKHPEWKDQTAINLHHIINVKDCRVLTEQGKPLSNINEYDNMCIMGCGTLEEVMQKKTTKPVKHQKLEGAHGAMHNYDTTFRNSMQYRHKWGEYTPPSGEDVIARMEPGPGVCCMMAFGKDFMIVDEQRKEQDLERQKGYVKVERNTPIVQVKEGIIEK